MTSEQRESLRQDVIRWIGSKDFDGYLKALHFDPMEFPVALLASVFHVGGFWPWDILRATNERGLATSSTRRQYLKLAGTGKVSLGYICKLENPAASTKNDCVPAFIVASTGGTVEDDELVEAGLALNDALRPLAASGSFSEDHAGATSGVFRAGKSAFDFGDPS